MDLGETAKKLAQMTDEGVFERLVTAILREANPEYSALAHPGVNVDGKTVKAPVDGICFVPGAQPPHMIAAHHTICARDDLERKWLHDPATVTARKGTHSSGQPGDLIKTATIVATERQRIPTLRATLILTTNKEPAEGTIRNVHAAGHTRNIDIDIWFRSRLAHFLDNDPKGQWIRRNFLGVEPELLSRELLYELCRSSLSIHRPPDPPECWIERGLDRALTNCAQRDITFVVAESGLGKTVACYKWLSSHVNKGGYGLVLPSDVISSALTLDRAIDAALRQLHPGLESSAGAKLLSLCSPDHPLLLVVEDINHSGKAHQLAEKIANWHQAANKGTERPSPTWRLLCPLWPEVLTSSPTQVRSRVEELSLTGTSFSQLEGREAVQRRASIKGKCLSPLDAELISSALGHDPLLIALHNPDRVPDSHRVLTEFVEASLARVASLHADYIPADYRGALWMLSRGILSHRRFDPTWAEIKDWLGSDANMVHLLSHLAHTGDIIRLVGMSAGQRIGFRHDRVRDWLLVDSAAEVVRAGNLDNAILAEPHFAEVIGGVLVRDTIPPEFVERVLAANPLALFHALRLFLEPDNDTHHAVLSAIDRWLSEPRSHDDSNQHLRWEALSALSQTESTKVVALVRRFRDRTWTGDQARLRNGDISGGIDLCAKLEPGVTTPWRDLQMEHAKMRFGETLSRALDALLRQTDLTGSARIGALRLAGHLADSTLAEAIAFCWDSDIEKAERLADYLWAAAECCGDSAERYLGPICDAWAALPSESEEKHASSPRDRLAADNVRWAFRKSVPVSAIPYFIKRARNDDLRWQITYMLHEIDHPAAVEFVVGECAATERRLNGTKMFSPFLMSVLHDWKRHQDETGAVMSEACRQMLLKLWLVPSTDKYLRHQAFRFWSVTHADTDLEILRAVNSFDPLGDDILWARLIRRDHEAIPAWLEKIRTGEKEHWWQLGRHIWSPELTAALDEELTQRGAQVSRDWNQKWRSDWMTYELIMRLPLETGEAMLLKHWDHLRFSSYFIQAALYVATPRLCELVSAAVTISPAPKELLKHLSQHFGIKTTGHPGITREGQVEAITPYLDLLDVFEIDRFWELCNERGWYDLRRKHFDSRLVGHREQQYLDESRAMEALDAMVNEKRLYWVDHWLDDFSETGATIDQIMALLAKWYDRQKTLHAMQLLASALIHAGRRRDLTILKINDGMPKDAAEALSADTEFAVKRRTLH